MLIDWFTVGAQAINFLILVWLLRRYLFDPITKAIEVREKEITARRQEAAVEIARGQQERQRAEQLRESLERHRMEVINDVKEEAKAERERLQDELQSEMKSLREVNLKALKEEVASNQSQLATLFRREIVKGTRKALGDLASQEMEDAVVQTGVRRLQEAPRGTLLAGGNSHRTGGTLRMRTAFPLSASRQNQMKEELRRRFGAETSVQFDVDPKLILGLDLTTGTEKWSWNAEDYFSSFQTKLEASIDANAAAFVPE